MSIKTENGVYESEPVSTSDGMCLEVFETSGRFIYVPKMENSEADSATLDVFENTWESEDSILPEDEELEPVQTGPYRCKEELPDARLYSEKLARSSEEGNFEEDEKLVYEEEEDEEEEEEKLVFEDSAMEVDHSDDPSFENYQDDEEAEDVDVSDEETIATFLTANGQRLALYAVEDSDQVFAVAVYDESGEPPTNFQFLMKSDVERLIGEGAVKTVRKPTRMKERFVTDETTIYHPGDTETSEQEPRTVDGERNLSEDEDDRAEDKTTIRMKIERTEAGSVPFFDDRADSCPQPRITSLIAHKFSSSRLHHRNEPAEEEEADDEEKKDSKLPISLESGELVERSTVDSLLMDSDGSDGELTFADVEESLGNLRSRERPSPECPESPCPENVARTETVVVITAAIADIAQIENECLAAMDFAAETTRKKTTSIVRRSHASSSLIRRGDDSAKRQRASLLIGNNERVKAGPGVASEATASSPKAKRPRKQQLTSVNRGDSEIIIQPATFPPSQEEQTRKKRKVHRPRRKPVGRTNLRYKIKSSVGKRLHGEKGGGRRANAVEPRRYEVIEIDVDDEDRASTLDARRRSIVEITIDDGAKDKGSSDKENEVIMVGDSDDDDDDDDDEDEDDEIEAETPKSGGETSVVSSLRCEHCSRSFRRKKSVETHARICSESPLNAARTESERSAASNDSPKKHYACKICHEEFDVVVVLARHVRAMHSLRKKGNPNLAAGKAEETTSGNALRTRRERAKSGDANDTSRQTNAPNKKSQTEHAAGSAGTKSNAGPGRGRRRRRRRKLTRTRTTETRSNSDSRGGWNGDKLYCSECAKWFSSAASLASHSLRHATKKTEKQTRRCEKCEKNFETRVLYIRHTKMHDRIDKLQKKLHHTRQASTVKLATLRKRTRPRKL